MNYVCFVVFNCQIGGILPPPPYFPTHSVGFYVKSQKLPVSGIHFWLFSPILYSLGIVLPLCWVIYHDYTMYY